MSTIRKDTAKGCPKAVLLPGLAADGGIPPERRPLGRDGPDTNDCGCISAGSLIQFLGENIFYKTERGG